MIPSVRSDFVTRVRDRLDQVGMPFRHPPEDEERRSRPMPLQQGQQQVYADRDATLELIPISP